MVKSLNNLDLHLKLWHGQIYRHLTPAVLLFTKWMKLTILQLHITMFLLPRSYKSIYSLFIE